MGASYTQYIGDEPFVTRCERPVGTDDVGCRLYFCGVDTLLARRLDHPQTVSQPGIPPSEKRRMELLPDAHLLPPDVFDACGFDGSMFYQDEELEREYRREFGIASPCELESSDFASNEDHVSGPEGSNQLPNKQRAAQPPPATAQREESSYAEGSTARRRMRIVVDPELSRARRASLRPRAGRSI